MAAFSAIEDFYDCRLELLYSRWSGGTWAAVHFYKSRPCFRPTSHRRAWGRSNLRLAGSAVTGGRRGAASNRRVASARVSLSRSRARTSSDRLPATADAVAHERSDNCLPISSTHPKGHVDRRGAGPRWHEPLMLHGVRHRRELVEPEAWGWPAAKIGLQIHA